MQEDIYVMSNKGDVICFSHKKQVPILSVSIKKD